MKNMKKNGTQVPGPFEIKWVVLISFFVTKIKVNSKDLIVVKIAVTLFCLT